MRKSITNKVISLNKRISHKQFKSQEALHKEELYLDDDITKPNNLF